VIRNGHHDKREVLTAAGAITVPAPRVNGGSTRTALGCLATDVIVECRVCGSFVGQAALKRVWWLDTSGWVSESMTRTSR
jgi:hypothetical protein